MSLNRNQMTLCAIGGVFAVGAAALGWFLWSAIDESGEALGERDSSMSAIDNFYSAKVFPSAESLEAVNANTAEIAAWRETAKIIAARGDKSFVETTPPSFKQFLQSEQVRLSSLPGMVDGKICAPGFAFGFDKYLGQSPTMPERNDLPKLQRQLDFIAEAVELFADAGIAEVKAVKRDDSPAAPVVEEAAPAPRPARGKGNKQEAAEGPIATSLEYSFQLLASPKALVTVMNRLNSEFRFTVVTTLNFTSSRDLISENFAARDKAESDAKNNQGNRRRRRGRGEAEAEEEDAVKPADTGIVIDPEIDAPLTVDLTVKVYDFGQGIAVAETAAAPAEAAASAESAPEGGTPAPEGEKPAAETAPEAAKPAEAAEKAEADGEAKEEAAK